ncbi:MAG: DUF3786 domain-containing protein [Deltaproteobacteria bacterium]|nr:DUF3786 domain-containing protein [Deltaproteobacteria bacterium]MBW1954523.1 DUF3786 domain-containing protein [Deltaproteobacteria bacterium]MBW2041737.1 DUF3786 domain-containing protein [Deltaproteobacteria bacterium]MBW2131022.1 DUF3786 domain-containing protein [Deltaproteobacteria bacterium]
MPRIDDYIASRNLAVEDLARESFSDLRDRTGFSQSSANTFLVPFLDRVYHVRFPDFFFEDRDAPEKEVPIQEQVLILHYMAGSKPAPPEGHWISYREIPGASFYYSAFLKRAVEPLKNVFGHNTGGLKKAAGRLGAVEIPEGDNALEYFPFPKVPMRLILWAGDDEFGPEANIVFDRNIGSILSPEDVAWMAGMVVYRLIALSR